MQTHFIQGENRRFLCRDLLIEQIQLLFLALQMRTLLIDKCMEGISQGDTQVLNLNRSFQMTCKDTFQPGSNTMLLQPAYDSQFRLP